MRDELEARVLRHYFEKKFQLNSSFDYVMSVREEDASSVQTDVDRWSPGVTFGEFTERTLNKYY